MIAPGDRREALQGATVVVTRARSQASTLVRALAERGAHPLEVPVIEVAPPVDDGAALRRVCRELDRYDWIVVTSANGVDALVDAAGGPEPLRDAAIAVVGPGTAARLGAAGLVAALVPDRFVAEGLLDAFPAPPPSGGRVLVPQAEAARAVLVDGLAERGWRVEAVTAYRTIAAEVPPELRRQVATADVVTFTSSSTVERYVEAMGTAAVPPVVACIGPVTARAAQRAGLFVDVVAEPHTVEGLVASLAAFLDRRP